MARLHRHPRVQPPSCPPAEAFLPVEASAEAALPARASAEAGAALESGSALATLATLAKPLRRRNGTEGKRVTAIGAKDLHRDQSAFRKIEMPRSSTSSSTA